MLNHGVALVELDDVEACIPGRGIDIQCLKVALGSRCRRGEELGALREFQPTHFCEVNLFGQVAQFFAKRLHLLVV